MMRNSWIVAGMAALLLSNCALGTGNAPTADGAPDTGATPATSVRLVDRDVEAPEVFQTTASGLWDGRPSLGGVWVASSDAKNPERVIMRNAANGKFVIGGLFQRDASLPGPKLQLSSDAADALGLLAGQPAEINVTALRREEAGAPTPDATKPLLDTNLAQGDVEATPTDVAATAAAAIDAAAPNPAPAKPGAKPAASASQSAAATAPAAQPAKPAAQTTPAASDSGSLIQIGIFSIEANAKRASDVLTKAGIASTTTREVSHDKPLWSVTTRGDAALLAKIKAAGFKDAYVLKR